MVEAFFLLEKTEPLVFCLKVCPLYCSPRRRRSDDDLSSLIYADEDFIPYPYFEGMSVAHRIYPYCKHTSPRPTHPTSTTPVPTSPKPTSTTEEPTWICMVCTKKCNFPAKY
ncbi:hypothetical protein evm_010082 [Chilo suppressalis]|nr:hypothetical protein evm_010082 [Chilo suppressalis]